MLSEPEFSGLFFFFFTLEMLEWFNENNFPPKESTILYVLFLIVSIKSQAAPINSHITG